MKVDQEKVKRWTTDKGYIHIREEYCKGCGACIEFCPRDVLEESDQLHKKGYRPPGPVLEKLEALNERIMQIETEEEQKKWFKRRLQQERW